MSVISSHVILPKEMPEQERINLAKRVYDEAHSKIFEGLSFEEFYLTVFTPNTLESKIMIYTQTKTNKIIGYVSFHVYEITKNQNSFHIIMTEMGITQHCKHPVCFVMKEGIKHYLRYPHKKTYILDTVINPFLYEKCCRMFYQLYPKHNVELSPELTDAIYEVTNYFKWKINIKDQSIVRNLNWKLKKRYIANHPCDNVKNKDVNYYHHLITHYGRGKGLVVVIPWGIKKNFIYSEFKVLMYLLLGNVDYSVKASKNYCKNIYYSILNKAKEIYLSHPELRGFRF